MYKMVKQIFVFLLIIFTTTSAIALNLNDNGKISATNVNRIVSIKTEADILHALQEARANHLPVTIMGVQHSQGGQTVAANAMVLDMRSFNKVLSFYPKTRQITVQSGILWSDVQKYINPYNLAVTSMQSPNIFTVGGSLSVNAHGDDFRAGSVGNSVIAFHLLLADGKKVYVTEQTHPDLWKAVIGGYGLIGVISDVTLRLTYNTLLISHFQQTDVATFSIYFQKQVLSNKDTTLFYAHLNIVPNASFLQDMYVITYTSTHTLPTTIIPLINPNKYNNILTPIFNMSRQSEIKKKIRWKLEQLVFSRHYHNKIVTRNNAMEKPVSFASDYSNPANADWLQEYFIPVDGFEAFIKALKSVVLAKNINLLNITVRYVPAENNFLLSYAHTNRFAIVLYFNQDLSVGALKKAQTWTQQLIEAAQSMGGSYYLPYQPMASKKQFQKSYTHYREFLKIKKQYDPENLFNSRFYTTYIAESG